MKNYLKKYIGEIISFFLTAIILLIVFKLIGILDNNSLFLKSDLLYQSFPLTTLFNNFIHGKVGFYIYQLGLGDTFFGVFYYYLTSPFNFLLVIFKDSALFFIIIFILKACFSSLFCYKYLKYQFKEEKRYYLIIFSLLYSLSSYFISYNIVIEFLDIYMLFPLLLLGIDRIVKEKKYSLYIFIFLAIIFCNYYFAYMVCIFSFFYYNYRILNYNLVLNKVVKNNLFFIFITFISCLTMSFIFIPIISEIGSYSRDISLLFGGEKLKLLFNLQNIVNHYIIGNFNNVTILNADSFYIYSSIITIVLIYFYFINNKFSKKEKLLTMGMFIILILSIGFNYTNYIWHGFTPPNFLNGRFCFMFILFIIMICCKSLYYIKKFDFKYYLYIFLAIYSLIFLYSIIYYPRLIDIFIILRFLIVYLVIVSITLFIKNKNIKYKYYLLVCLFLIITYIFKIFNIIIISKILLVFLCVFLLYFLVRKREVSFKHFIYFILILLFPLSIYSIFININLLGSIVIIKLLLVLCYIIFMYYIYKNRYIKYLLVLFVIVEIIINNYNYLYRFSYKSEYDYSYEEVIKYIKKNDKNLFYRIDDSYFNNSLLYDFYGVDYFMSTVKEDFVNFFYNLDLSNYSYGKNVVDYDGSYHFLSALLNIKYFVSKDDKDIRYSKINNISEYNIYLNNDNLGLGYIVNTKINDLSFSSNGLENINNIYKYMVNNEDNILDNINIKKNNLNNYSFINTSNRDMFLLVDLDEYVIDSKIDVYLNDSLINNRHSSSIFEIKNTYDIDSIINIKIDCDKDTLKHISGVYLYYYNDDIFLKDINFLKNNQLVITNVSRDRIEGNINTLDDGILFLSVLYNDDLDVYVDGVLTSKSKILDTFIGVDIGKGKHTIVLKYKPRILYWSIIPSVVGLCLIILFLYKNKYDI